MHFSKRSCFCILCISSSGLQDRMANTNEDGGGHQPDRLEVVREAVGVRCSKKEYNIGKLACDPGFIYLVVLENPNYLFPSISVLHSVELVSKDSASPPYELLHLNSVDDLGTGSWGGENNNSNGRSSSSTPGATVATSSKKGRQPRSKSAKPATASSHSSVGITPQPQRPPIPEADREAKIEDLLNFVFEITAADAARRQKTTGNIDSGRATSKKASSSRTRGQSKTEKTTVEATIEAAPHSKGSSSSSSSNKDSAGAKKRIH